MRNDCRMYANTYMRLRSNEEEKPKREWKKERKNGRVLNAIAYRDSIMEKAQND